MTACPVPSCSVLADGLDVADERLDLLGAVAGDDDHAFAAAASRAASMTRRTIGSPRISWATLGFEDFMRVPSPAARIRATALMASAPSL